MCLVIDRDDIIQTEYWLRYYDRRKHLFEKPCEFCLSKKRWVQHLRRSEIAVENERQRNRGFWIDIEDDDNYERSYKRRSNFEEDKNLDLFCGDIFSDRFWYKISEQEIDKTKKLPFWVEPENYQVDEDWYTKSPQEFNKVQRLLTPWAARRQYGKVFFSTATYYVSKEKTLILSRKLRVEGYYKIDGKKIVQDFVKAPRSVLLEPPRTGVISYPNKAFAAAGYETTYTYHLSGNGILKRRTFEGKLYLNYITLDSKVNWYDKDTDELRFETQLGQQLLINKILPNTHEYIGTRRKMKSYGLQYQDMPYNKEFWENYNVIKESPLDRKIIEDLEKNLPLEIQFEHH